MLVVVNKGWGVTPVLWDKMIVRLLVPCPRATSAAPVPAYKNRKGKKDKDKYEKSDKSARPFFNNCA